MRNFLFRSRQENRPISHSHKGRQRRCQCKDASRSIEAILASLSGSTWQSVTMKPGREGKRRTCFWIDTQVDQFKPSKSKYERCLTLTALCMWGTKWKSYLSWQASSSVVPSVAASLFGDFAMAIELANLAVLEIAIAAVFWGLMRWADY